MYVVQSRYLRFEKFMNQSNGVNGSKQTRSRMMHKPVTITIVSFVPFRSPSQ